jgi:tetratricopeptide (TPR) repeat protein
MNDWQDAEQRFERALELFQQRKWPQALEELRLATTINPFNSAWLFSLGLILDEMGRHEEALDAYRRARQIEPNNLQVLERLGMDLSRTSRLREALRTFAEMSAMEPSHEPSYCHRILIYGLLGEHETAEEMFYTARLYKEQCPRCYDYMGRSLAARKLHDKAIFCFQKCVDLDPAWPQAMARLGQAYWNKGDLEQARRHFLADLRQNPGRTRTLLNLGDLLQEMGRIGEAGEKYRHCIELAPNEPGAFLRYGRWLARGRQYEDARVALDRSLRLDPTLCGTHLELARLAWRKGDRAGTRFHLRSEHLLHCEDAHLLLGLANLWMDCGEDRTAIACLKRLIELQPKNSDAWLNLAVAQFRRGLYDEGIRSCRQVLSMDASNRLAMYNLALAHERQAQWDRAWEWAQMALELEPRDANLRRLELRLRVLRRGALVIGRLRRLLRPFF